MGELANLRVRSIAGGAAGAHTVSGIEPGDRLISVTALGSDTDVLTPVELTDEFTITAVDTIDNTGGTATTDGVLQVIFEKYASGRADVRNQPGRSAY